MQIKDRAGGGELVSDGKGGIFRIRMLGGLLAVSLAAVVVLPIYTYYFIYPSFIELLMENTEEESERIARHLSAMFVPDEEAGAEGLPDDLQRQIEHVLEDFNLAKVKIFSSSGSVLYSTDPGEVGQVNEYDYFREIVAKGGNYSKIVRKDAETLEGKFMEADVVETYVPVMDGEKFVGAFEIYFDITERRRRLDGLLSGLNAALITITAGLSIAVVLSMLKTRKTIAERNLAEERLIEKDAELEDANEELSILYGISYAISRTIDIEKLLPMVLKTVTAMETFGLEKKGGIFIIEGEDMRLVSHLGHTEEFLGLHDGMKIGDCLCGLAAKTGEIIVSRDSHADERHSFRYPDMAPHGHLIVPLKAAKKLVGVLYLYTSAGAVVDENKIRMLSSIGNMIGVVLENARLHAETKALSLKDPLTGLANRRLMDIVFEDRFAQSKRYGKRLSALMLDIDRFKNYNDTHGHEGGDKLLREIACIISNEMRAADLAVRFGGEEFLVLLPETGLQEAVEAAERIRRAIAEKTDVTVSLGAASYREGMEDKDDLIKESDEALYEAKNAGRNRVCSSDMGRGPSEPPP